MTHEIANFYMLKVDGSIRLDLTAYKFLASADLQFQVMETLRLG